jgi:hypothetical protein
LANTGLGRFGFVDAIHPSGNWYNSDFLGVDLSISLLMAENLRIERVWNTLMSNPEPVNVMRLMAYQ